MKIVAVERFARTDTSVTPQALKLTSANPDAIVVVASGSGAAMPQMAMVERGYKGKIYQTHAAATPDLMRIGGKDVEGTFVVSGPAVVAEQLPDSHPSKKVAIDFVRQVREGLRPGAATSSPATPTTSTIVMEKIVPVALKKAKPGTPEFRAALRDSHGDHGPHRLRPRRDELDQGRPLGLHQRDRRDAARSWTASSSSRSERAPAVPRLAARVMPGAAGDRLRPARPDVPADRGDT